MRWLLILPAFLVFGAAPTSAGLATHEQQRIADEQELAKALNGLTPSKPQTCINLRDARDTQRVGDTILYKVGRKLIYRTDTNGGCFGLDRGDIIVTRTFNGELCRGDIISTVDPVSRTHTGSCTFGDFIAYKAS